MFQLSGRVSSISGDPARWQRYQDLRDGLLFTQGRVLRETPDWNGSFSADNVGWRDQRYFGSYERIGLLKINGLWDEIPQFYSVDTTHRVHVESGDGVLVLDDAAQRAANLNAYLPISPQFDLRESRKIGTFRVSATPTTQLDLTGGFTTTKHSGELPWGASFGFSNDNEVALPYRSRTNDVDMGLQWTNSKAMFRAAYNGSWFNNDADTLTWDNPLVLTDSTSASGHGRTALWPSNSLQTLSTAGYAKFARRTQLTGSLAFGLCEQRRAAAAVHDQQCAAAVRAAARDRRGVGDHRCHERQPRVASGQTTGVSARGSAATTTTTTCPRRAIPQFINYDTSVKTARPAARSCRARPQYVRRRRHVDRLPPGGPHGRLHQQPQRLRLSHLRVDQRERAAAQGRLDRFRVGDTSARATSTATAAVPASTKRRSSQIGEQPQMRHYDLADRTRNRFVGQVDVVPTEALTFSLSGGVGTDDFDDSYFGLQEAAFRNVTVSVDYMSPRGFGVGGSYNYERYSGLQRSRSASPGQSARRPIPTATGPPIQRNASTTFRSTCSRLASAPTPRRVSPTNTRTRAGTSSTTSDPRCRRRRSCRRPSTSCRTSGSTSGIA